MMGKGVWAGFGLLFCLIAALLLQKQEEFAAYEAWEAACVKSGGVVLYNTAKSLCIDNKFIVEVK